MREPVVQARTLSRRYYFAQQFLVAIAVLIPFASLDDHRREPVKDSVANDIQCVSELHWTPSTTSIVSGCGIWPFDATALRRALTKQKQPGVLRAVFVDCATCDRGAGVYGTGCPDSMIHF